MARFRCSKRPFTRWRLETIESLLLESNARIERLVDELSQYEGYAIRDVIREKIKAIESEKNMLSQEAERLVNELEQNNISPDVENQIRRTAAIIREKLSGATFEDKCRILEILDVRAKHYFDEQRGDILEISCMIPFGDGQIVLPPSLRWLHALSNSCLTAVMMRTSLNRRIWLRKRNWLTPLKFEPL